MMKFICVYVVILLASISLCHADGFKIRGKISGGGEGVKVFLTDLSQYRHFYDSTTIKNGEFEFNGKVESPEMRCITIYKNDSQRGEWKSTVKLPIFVDNSSMTLEAPYDSLPTKSSKTVPGCIKITGSPANDLYMKYDKGLEPLSTLILHYSRSIEWLIITQRPMSWDVRICNPLMTLWKNWRIVKMRFIVTSEIYSREFGFSGSPVCCWYVGDNQVRAR